MKSNTEKVLSYIGLSEGGYVNHPKDPGGATNMGVTQAVYDAYNKLKGNAQHSVKNITKGEAHDIFVRQYFDPIKFDELPSGLDYSVADFAVNSGPKRAAIELQRALGFDDEDVDGLIGMKTLEAIRDADIKQLIITYNVRRLSFVQSLSTWSTFGKGWNARIMGKMSMNQKDDIGVIDRSVAMYENALVIPPPVVATEGKALDKDEKTTSLIGKIFQDPVAVIPVIGTAITPLADFNVYVQGALAFAIVATVVFALVRSLKRDKNA